MLDEDVPVAASICAARWQGDPDILDRDSPVELLAVDGAGRISRTLGVTGVLSRTACWIRYWPDSHDYAEYRSCDLSDLKIEDADFDRLIRKLPA